MSDLNTKTLIVDANEAHLLRERTWKDTTWFIVL